MIRIPPVTIPSYDDLTPSIPDIDQADVFAAVAQLLSASAHASATPASAAAPAGPAVCPAPAGRLFAALHGRATDPLFAIARDFSPRIERHGATDVVLDVAGLGRLLGDAHAIGAELARAGARQVALAPTQTAAVLLARTRPGVTIAGDVDGALRDVPLRILYGICGADAPPQAWTIEAAAPGDGAAVFETFRRWGLRTLGDLAALPAADLSARLGRAGIAIQRLARGEDPRPLVPDPGVPRFIESMELEWPIEELEPLSFVFARLLDPLAAALERADRAAAAIHLDLRLVDRTTWRRSLQLPAAMRDPRVLRTLLLLDLESHPPSAGVDIVTIEVDPAPARIVQYSLLQRALPSVETLATLNARLGALVGASRCGSPVLLDTYRPDGFELRVFDPAQKGTAPLSAAGKGDSPLLRRFRPPVAIRVTLERGRPVRIAIDRQGMPGGRVAQAAGPWRASGDWWTAARWNRDEWDLALSDGSVCRIFRDRDAGLWFMDGMFD